MGEARAREKTMRTLLQEAQRHHQANRLAEAKAAYQYVLRIDPVQPEALYGLGLLARQVGLMDVAVKALAKAVDRAPDSVEYRVHYAQALQDSGQLESAADQFQRALRLRPDEASLWESLGIVQQSLGDVAAAAQSYRQSFRLSAQLGARIKLATLVSPIVSSRAAMAAERNRMEAELDSLLSEMSPETDRIDDPLRAALWTHFYLAFHGENNRSLQAKYTALCLKACPSLSYCAPHCSRKNRAPGRIRVGLLSRFFFNHSIGRTSRGLFACLAREEFEVIAIFVAPLVDDDYSRFIRDHAERFVVVPQDLAKTRQLIEDLQLDVLFYQDIGMEPFSYFLAFSRLAPVQCVSFGHPDTTGIPTIDYFVSNDLYETSAGQRHYSEALFLLHDLGTLAYYYRPELPRILKRRADFGLREEDHLYICPQNLFKFHPDMDPLIAGILRRDSRGMLLLVEGRIRSWTDILLRRWASVMPDVVDRIVFLPRQNSQDYVNLIGLADVMLDTVHFNGMNTSLEAFSVGTPVITWPGEFQRGRHTQAMYRKMGMTEGVAGSAAEYIELAVRIANDNAYRDRVRQDILSRNQVLFEDIDVVREFERFFREAVASWEHRAGQEAVR